MSNNLIPVLVLRHLRGRYAPGETWRGLHQHPEWQFDLLHAGSMHIHLADRTIRLRPREAILLPPELPHALVWHAPCVYSSFKFYWAGAPSEALGHSTVQPSVLARPAAVPVHQWRAGDLDANLLQGLLNSATHAEESAIADSACWLHLLLRSGLQARAADTPHPRQTLPEQIETLVAAGGYRPIPLAQMAEACRLSKAQFLRRFRQVAGTTPGKYVLRLRLARAETLLRFGEMKMARVAQALGWPDVFTFSKAWKRERGQSPRASLRGGPGDGAF